MAARRALNPFRFRCHVLPVACSLLSSAFSLLRPLLSSALVFVLTTIIAYSSLYFFSLSFSPSLNQALCLRLRQWFPCKITLPTVILHTLLHTSANILHFFITFCFLPFMRKCTCTNTTLPTRHAKNLFSGYLDWCFFFFFVVHSFRQQTPLTNTLSSETAGQVCWRFVDAGERVRRSANVDNLH